jgi:hypothetical protein
MAVSAELRRRRLARPAFAAEVARARDTTWIPCSGGTLRNAPKDLLVLAGISLARSAEPTSPLRSPNPAVGQPDPLA